MLKSISKIFGDSNESEIKKLRPLVSRINAIEAEVTKLTDEDLRARTETFKAQVDGDPMKLERILPEAFSIVREMARRRLGQRHYDVQLIGGAILHQGKIAEMRTGEGKTLVATLPTYLNALTGRGVHVVTVNDYLAKRDTQWMGKVYHGLGLSVACLQHDTAYLFDPSAPAEDERFKDLRQVSRQDAYAADVTYGTNSEFGFDYLRDNMVVELAQRVQRPLHYAVVDEVDNILVDEARTPLIISGQSAESAEQYAIMARIVPSLRVGEDYEVDEKARSATLTQDGITKLEQRLGITNLYDPANYLLTHYADNALRSFAIYKCDVDYVVKDGEVILVDEFTGRLMVGRRLSDGLHQAIEAKEGVHVQPETVTLATITLQNYFRLYEKLAGMTGTAATEAEEFFKIYKLEVLVVPTNKPMIRKDEQDLIFKSQGAKLNAVVAEIEEASKGGRPVLVGTVSIENSERLSGMLTRKGVRHEVLNAKQHEREAPIVAQAGRLHAVTVATNMAGRGTDIVLGGTPDGRTPDEWKVEHEAVVQRGGLFIIGTERHEARRIDNQLRGRAGRQGDPGLSRFYVSLEDDLMRRFGGDRIKSVMDWAGVEDDQPLQHGLISKSIENAQSKVEGFNFDIRKRLIDYDDVANKHREVIYGERRKILEGAALRTNIEELVTKELSAAVYEYMPGSDSEQWDFEGLFNTLKVIFPLPADLTEDTLAQMSHEEAKEAILDYADELYDELEAAVTPDIMRVLERMVMLRTIDTHWVEHLTAMENMRQSIGLQGVAQMDPLVAYKRQGQTMFSELSERIQSSIARAIYHAAVGQRQYAAQQQAKHQMVAQPAPRVVAPSREQQAMAAAVTGASRHAASETKKVGRNDPCWCGSGKKFKRCHGA